MAMRGAVVGFGNIGRKLAGAFTAAGAKMVLACDPSPARREEASREFGMRVSDDSEAVAGPDIDFVVIASPTCAHAAQVALAAEAGKAVFCEVPIATNEADADCMAQAVRHAGVLGMADFGRPYFQESSRYAKRLLDSGELGELLELSVNRQRGFGLHAGGARHWAVEQPERSGGWAVHHGVQGLFQMRWFAGPVASLFAHSRGTAPAPAGEEMVSCLLVFHGGASGTLTDGVGGIPEEEWEIRGSRGGLAARRVSQGWLIRSWRETGREQELGDAKEELLPPDRNGFLSSAEHFLACLRRGEPSPLSLDVGWETVRLAAAMRRSAQSGAVIHNLDQDREELPCQLGVSCM